MECGWQVWEAVQEMAAASKWRVDSVPTYISRQNEAQLASGNPHDLSPVTIPQRPPCLSPDRDLPAIEVLSQPASNLNHVLPFHVVFAFLHQQSREVVDVTTVKRPSNRLQWLSSGACLLSRRDLECESCRRLRWCWQRSLRGA